MSPAVDEMILSCLGTGEDKLVHESAASRFYRMYGGELSGIRDSLPEAASSLSTLILPTDKRSFTFVKHRRTAMECSPLN